MEKDYVIVMDPMGGAHIEHRSHKYTKREWQGKGWRYWYGSEYKKDANNAKYMASKESEYAKTMRGYIINKKDDPWNPYLRKEVYNSNKKAAEYARTAYNSQKLYDKSLAGRIEKGKEKVQSLLSKIKKKVSTAYDKATDKAVSKAFDTAEKLSSKIVKEARKRGYGKQIETRTDISTGQKWRRVNGGAWEKVR